MKKIKLPRKRKKAYITKYGHGEYIAQQIINEIKNEEIKEFKFSTFPEYKTIRIGKYKLLFNW